MATMSLHDVHARLQARYLDVSGHTVVDHYGDPTAEHAAFSKTAGVIDLGARSRLCLTGSERQRFLHGQVTNNVQGLAVGQGCYAALVTAKGRLISDLNIYCLPDELLLDFEPGLAAKVTERLEKYIIADDVQVVDVSGAYGLVSVQGPRAAEVLARLELPPPAARLSLRHASTPALGDIYCMNQPRGPAAGYDVFVPEPVLATVFETLLEGARAIGGGAGGWQALEMIRIEAGQPRFGADMDETNLAPEAGIEERAISYAKGCYIGQEVIARIRTYGQVAKSLRGLLLPADLPPPLPQGGKLLHNRREAGYITSVLASPSFRRNVALGYVRRECNQPGTQLQWLTPRGQFPVEVVPLPFPYERF